ncbi:MAG: tetratricopeptide repeat protein [Acidobacteriia bacterium]|nr:tetratricopeptide repeat protein [Terriglobia bacterium]
MNGNRDREVYRVGDLTLDVETRLLTRAGTLVPLPPKTFELLVELVRRSPGVVRRQELLDTVWAHELVNDEALTQRVMLLRRALGDDPKEPKFIASAPRWGYRLVAPVERLEPTPSHPVASTRREDAPGSNDRLRVLLATTRSRSRRLVWLSAILVVAVATLVGTLALQNRRHAIDSLAIAPFRAIEGSGSEVEYLCDGIPETLNRTLRSAVPGLRIIAESSMARYKGAQADPQRIRHDFGVRAVLTGTLLRRADKLVIDTVLADAQDGTQLWDAHTERPVADLLAVQDEISQEIVKGLRIRLSGTERTRLARRPTESVEAYTLYLKGRYFWDKRNEKGFEDAIACFKAAIDQDPAYALAYAGLADCYAIESTIEYGAAAANEAMPRARALARKALVIDADLAEAHASLGLVLWLYDWDRAGAERELRRAARLDRNCSQALQWLAEMLAEQGRSEEADEEIRRAIEVDPLSLVINADRGLFAYYQRDYEPAVQYYRQTLAMEPSFGQAWLGLGLAYAQQGEHEKAIEAVRHLYSLAPITPVMAALGYVNGMAGKKDEARNMLDELLALAKRRYVSSYYVAGVFIGLGDRDRAFEWLGRAGDERASLLGSLRVDPAFDPLQSDPRFAVLLARVGLAK